MLRFLLIVFIYIIGSVSFAHDHKVDDGNLFGVMESISRKLIDNNHSQAQLKKSLKFLKKANDALEPEVESALLVISGVDPVSFGTVASGGIINHTFTIVNAGSNDARSIAEVSLSAPFEFSGGGYPGVGGTCASVISSATNCTIVVSFAPTSTGLSVDSIDLSYDDGNGNTVSVSRDVEGVSVAPASIAISGTNPIDFGSVLVGGVGTVILSITNGGGYEALAMSGGGLISPLTFAGGSYPGTGGTCTSVLSPGATCTVSVVFRPFSIGVFVDTLNILYFDGVVSQASLRDLTGVGVWQASTTAVSSSTK